MALLTKRGRDLPEGSIALTEQEALDHQRDVVKDWPQETDVFFLKYGTHVASVATFISSGVILNHFRNTLNIPSKLLFSAFSTSFLWTSYMSNRATDRIITSNTLLMKFQCPLCRQLKYALAQSYLGIIFPTVYGLSVYTVISSRRNTYEFGAAKTVPKVFWKEMYKLLLSGTRAYQIAGLMQSILVLSLPYMMAKEIDTVTEKLQIITYRDEVLES